MKILWILRQNLSCNVFYLFHYQDDVTTIWRHNHFKSAFCWFVHAILTELRDWRHFSLLVELVYLFIRVINFLVCLFTFFLRLKIYEAIAAIFWQFASYVFF